MLGAFRSDFRISFFNAALMKDSDGVLEKQGPNSRYADVIRFRSITQVAEMEPVILSYLEEAMGYAEAGIKPQKEEFEIVLPEELLIAMESDPELADAFYCLTAGRQKSYMLNINSAKKAETRVARVAKFRDRIIVGKGATER